MLKILSKLSRKICFSLVRLRNVPNHVVFLINEVPTFYNYSSQCFEIGIYELNFEKIIECAEWCLELGIEEMSAYMFSCLTFKFQKEEVGKVIFTLERTVRRWILLEQELRKKGIRIKIFDLYSILPRRIATEANKLCDLTKNNNLICVNIFLGWIGEIEFAALSDEFEKMVKENKLTVEDLTREFLLKRLMNYENKEPDFVISNCKYKRATDYLIWKVPSRLIFHYHVLWYLFNFLHLTLCLVFFQRHRAIYLKRIENGDLDDEEYIPGEDEEEEEYDEK